jgi:putative nucleotidyltransferase with HDIG domain
MKSLGRLPPFSPLLHRLMGELALDAVSFKKLADLIEGDTVLASNVLRVVNSSLYGMQAKVNSVRHGVSMLGVGNLRNIVLTLSVSQLWNRIPTPAGWSMQHFNRHSTAVAMLADLVALETNADYAEGAFTAGLLHDMGKLLIAIALPEEFMEINRLTEANWSEEGAHEEAILGLSHADLSAAALTHWNLPAPIVEAVRRHHAPPAEGRLALSSVLYVADRTANQLGVGCRAAVTAGGDPTEFLNQIGLADEAETLLGEFVRSFQVSRKLF